MPRMDKTGPEGKGPLTGRGLGNCTDKEELDLSIDSSFVRFGRRLGFGRQNRRGRRGFGRGFGRR